MQITLVIYFNLTYQKYMILTCNQYEKLLVKYFTFFFCTLKSGVSFPLTVRLSSD